MKRYFPAFIADPFEETILEVFHSVVPLGSTEANPEADAEKISTPSLVMLLG